MARLTDRRCACVCRGSGVLVSVGAMRKVRLGVGGRPCAPRRASVRPMHSAGAAGIKRHVHQCPKCCSPLPSPAHPQVSYEAALECYYDDTHKLTAKPGSLKVRNSRDLWRVSRACSDGHKLRRIARAALLSLGPTNLQPQTLAAPTIPASAHASRPLP